MDINKKKIVITCGGGVGDLIMYTPALRKLKCEYNCQLILLTPRNKDVLDGLPYIDEIIYLQRGTILGKIRNLHRLKGTDVLIMTDWQPNVLVAAKFYGIPLIAGYPREGKLLSKIINREIHTKWYRTLDFVAKTHAKVISEALDINLMLEKHELQCDVAKTSEEDKIVIDKMLKEIGIDTKEQFFILAPFSNFKLKDWPIEYSKKLVTLIENKYGIPVVIVASADKIKESSEISKYSLAGKTSLTQLIEVISRGKLMISADSGQMHIAGALQIPLVPFFGKEIPERWAPKYNCWPVSFHYSCSPCKDAVALNCKKNVSCLYEITAEMIFNKVCEVLEKIRR